MRPWRLKVACSCIAGVALLLKPVVGHAQVARVELHTFASTTLTDEEFLSGKKEGKAVVLAGELRIPKPGTDRLPTVVLVHGSGGVSGFVDDWVPKLNAMGVATFVFDSYTPRGITSVLNDHSQLESLAMTVDAYRALALVAKHPRVDPDRIAVMGFSFGGHAALAAAIKRFARMHGPTGLSYALYIALYPLCVTRYLQDDEVADRPIRIFHGAADDLAPVAACRTYVERLQKAGRDATVTEYPGAYHVFDWASLKTATKVPQAQNMANCRIDELSEGHLLNSETKRPFTYNDPCVKRGATIGYNAEAHAEVVEAVTRLVHTVLKPK
jgi:dienelactone hydrolase